MSEETESKLKEEEEEQPEKAATESESSSEEKETAAVSPEPTKESETEEKSSLETKDDTSTAAATKNEGTAKGEHTAGDADPDQVKGDASQQDFAAYEQHVSYEADGGAIYTDPSTKQKYKWCNTQNSWQPQQAGDAAEGAENPFENEHYKWCPETQQWLPKQQQHSSSSETETEHYKWDAEQQKWLPKQQQEQQTAPGQNVVYGLDEQGERTYTDKDGAVFFWDASKSAWFPKIDDDFMARYQMNYGFIDNTSAGERDKAERETAEAKRKQEELKRMTAEAEAAMLAQSKDGIPGTTAAAAAAGKRKAQEPPKWFEMDPLQNTKVYVSNLPLDITIDEFAELMGKCGLVMRDPQTQKYKLKLYTEKNGQIKGDGLCDYIKVESVKLALEILDEYELRGHKIRVQRAQFQMRGEYNPALKPKRKKKDKEKMQKIKEKLFDWRPDKMRGERSKNEKTVVIKNLFTPELFEKEVELILEYQNNLREECGKCGIVRKVVIYDRHPEGIAQVNMSTPEEADVVIQMMHGRYFGQRQLSADHWDGKTKYKIDESAAEADKRLSKWDEYLTAEDAAKQEAEEAATSTLKKKEETATSALQMTDEFSSSALLLQRSLAEESPSSSLQVTEETPGSPPQMTEETPNSPTQLAEESPNSPIQLAEVLPRSHIWMAQESPSSPIWMAQGLPRSPVWMADDSSGSPFQMIEEPPSSPIRMIEDSPSSPDEVYVPPPTDDTA